MTWHIIPTSSGSAKVLKAKEGTIPAKGYAITAKGDLMALSSPLLVAARNALEPKQPIKVFRDKKTGVEQVWGRLQTLTQESVTSSGKRPSPRKNSYALGARIKKLVDSNPRRPGTKGHASWDRLRSGMTVAQYKEAGGRLTDLRWDVKHKYITIEVPSA